MTTKHDGPPQPEQTELFGNAPSAEIKNEPEPEKAAAALVDDRQEEIPLRVEKNIKEKTDQVQNLLTSEKTTLQLRTAQQREDNGGEYYESYHIPADELRTEQRLALTNKGESGPSLLVLRSRSTGSTFYPKKKPQTSPPPTFEIYFCPTGLSGSVEGTKLKPEISVDQFIQQWNS